MLRVSHYQRPLTCITIENERGRIVPGVVAQFSKPMANAGISLYAVSNGEHSICFYIDEKQTEKAMSVVTATMPKTSFGGVAVRRGLGLVSVAGPELATTPGLFYKLLTPVAKERINIFSVTTSTDSILMFFDYKDAAKAYQQISKYVPEKIGVFKGVRAIAGGVVKRILRR